MPISDELLVRDLGLVNYDETWERMKDFTQTRDTSTPDEIWLLQHQPVFTQGQAGKEEHLLMPGDIPVVQVDRGGQVTYHGPGQLVVYLLIDIRRKKIGVRDMVTIMEESIIDVLQSRNIDAFAKPDAPGVYVGEAKIASLGLRVRRGCTFHGLALNVDMDLEPFLRINPCGYAGMPMVDIRSLDGIASIEPVQLDLLAHLKRKIGYTSHSLSHSLEN